ncbi:MAG TPA: NUDIX hydrolase [Candidatus Omnitrophota bacterium]|nr:NUDIX hydrolase [Candidatus Omnitrophota bacterium]
MRVRIARRSKKHILHSGKFLHFVDRGGWEYFEHNSCSAIVIIVAMTKEGRVIFVEQYRPPVGKKVVEFPAGLVNDHKNRRRESIFSAAKRELMEETGYRAEKIVKLLEGPVSSGSSGDIVTMVRAFDLKKVCCGGGDEFENIIVHEVPLQETDRWLCERRKKGYLIEPKIYTGLYFLKQSAEDSEAFSSRTARAKRRRDKN